MPIFRMGSGFLLDLPLTTERSTQASKSPISTTRSSRFSTFISSHIFLNLKKKWRGEKCIDNAMLKNPPQPHTKSRSTCVTCLLKMVFPWNILFLPYLSLHLTICISGKLHFQTSLSFIQYKIVMDGILINVHGKPIYR